MTIKELRRKKIADLIAEYGSQKALGDAVGKYPAIYGLIDCEQGCEYADILEEKLFEANAYLHKNEIPYQMFLELWNSNLSESQKDVIHKMFEQLKSVSADRNCFAVTIQNKNKEIAKLEAEMEMLKQMLLESENRPDIDCSPDRPI